MQTGGRLIQMKFFFSRRLWSPTKEDRAVCIGEASEKTKFLFFFRSKPLNNFISYAPLLIFTACVL
jgi:hypothetical protein